MSLSDEALEEFRKRYPEFSIMKDELGDTVLMGCFELDAEYNDVRISETFSLKLRVPQSFPKNVPLVWEMSTHIPNGYKHLYRDHSFCLGINGEILRELLQTASLVRFMEGPVKSYLYSALYHEKYGYFPFGDRPHGVEGILQYYNELFNVHDDQSAMKLLKIVALGESVRGHLLCPCGSGIRTRVCHGKLLRSLAKETNGVAYKNDYLILQNKYKVPLNKNPLARLHEILGFNLTL